ncbi:MAG: hypothetical protein H6566_29960 [Lewinellaceae bacterium]|nr:hypothetical protein [Lewinellaceae bacterium]
MDHKKTTGREATADAIPPTGYPPNYRLVLAAKAFMAYLVNEAEYADDRRHFEDLNFHFGEILDLLAQNLER